MKSVQLSLLDAPPPGPEGLTYQAEFLSPSEEAELAGAFAALPFREFEFHGFLGKRRTVSFGYHYAFDGSGLREAEPIPDFLLETRTRAAALAGHEAEALRHLLIIEYAPGAGIGWHRDRPWEFRCWLKRGSGSGGSRVPDGNGPPSWRLHAPLMC